MLLSIYQTSLGIIQSKKQLHTFIPELYFAGETNQWLKCLNMSKLLDCKSSKAKVLFIYVY